MKVILNFNLLLLCTIVLSLTACKSPEKVDSDFGISWSDHKTLTEVIEQAEKENKGVFIDFYTDWCTPCKMMDKDVYTDQSVSQYFNENFINFKVNAEKKNGAGLAFLYQVQVYPVLLFVDHKGKELVRKDGAAYHTELMKMAKEAKMQFMVGS